MQLMIATGNQGKLREIKKIIAGFPEFLQTHSMGTV